MGGKLKDLVLSPPSFKRGGGTQRKPFRALERVSQENEGDREPGVFRGAAMNRGQCLEAVIWLMDRFKQSAHKEVLMTVPSLLHS